MTKRLLVVIVCLFVFLMVSCDSGGGSGSGGEVKTTYTAADVAGTWNWTMVGASGNVVTGTITLDGEHILAITNSTCTHIASGFLKLITDIHVKGRNGAWCTDTGALMKFGLDFVHSRFLSGIMDYHPANGGYKRYTWEMTKVQ